MTKNHTTKLHAILARVRKARGQIRALEIDLGDAEADLVTLLADLSEGADGTGDAEPLKRGIRLTEAGQRRLEELILMGCSTSECMSALDISKTAVYNVRDRMLKEGKIR